LQNLYVLFIGGNVILRIYMVNLCYVFIWYKFEVHVYHSRANKHITTPRFLDAHSVPKQGHPWGVRGATGPRGMDHYRHLFILFVSRQLGLIAL
jgi:hypothetical protein